MYSLFFFLERLQECLSRRGLSVTIFYNYTFKRRLFFCNGEGCFFFLPGETGFLMLYFPHIYLTPYRRIEEKLLSDPTSLTVFALGFQKHKT